ncbi:MAG: DNA methyltransferase, partial [Oscillospiraceae bacterium]|nr:DNA methyltransferase [Oscillospiraceae bacterium]
YISAQSSRVSRVRDLFFQIIVVRVECYLVCLWEEKTIKLHPHSKPLELQKALIEATTQEGDWVLDPASGGYSVLTACRELNRNFIGCDIEFGEEPQHTANAA